MVKVRIDSKLKDMPAEAFLELAKEINESLLGELNLKPNLPKYVIRAAYNRNKKTREVGKNISFLLDLFKEKYKNIKIYDDQYKSEKFNSILNNKKYSSDFRKKLSQLVDRKVILEQPRLSRIWKPGYAFALFLVTVIGISFMPAKYAYDSTEETIKNQKIKQEFIRYVNANVDLSDLITKNKDYQEKTKQEISNLEKAIGDKKASKFFCICPTDSINKELIEDSGREFGWRFHPIIKDPITGGPAKLHHDGIDIGGEKGGNVYAVKDGKVTANEWEEGYGWTVELKHAGGWKTKYAHNIEKSELKIGDQVKEGEIVAYIGKTGLATNNHIHFEIRKIVKKGREYKEYVINPLPLIKTKEELKYLNKDIDSLKFNLKNQNTMQTFFDSEEKVFEDKLEKEHAKHDSIENYINNSNMLELIF